MKLRYSLPSSLPTLHFHLYHLKTTYITWLYSLYTIYIPHTFPSFTYPYTHIPSIYTSYITQHFFLCPIYVVHFPRYPYLNRVYTFFYITYLQSLYTIYIPKSLKHFYIYHLYIYSQYHLYTYPMGKELVFDSS